jgi:hypothetical protein
MRFAEAKLPAGKAILTWQKILVTKLSFVFYEHVGLGLVISILRRMSRCLSELLEANTLVDHDYGHHTTTCPGLCSSSPLDTSSMILLQDGMRRTKYP